MVYTDQTALNGLLQWRYVMFCASICLVYFCVHSLAITIFKEMELCYAMVFILSYCFSPLEMRSSVLFLSKVDPTGFVFIVRMAVVF